MCVAGLGKYDIVLLRYRIIRRSTEIRIQRENLICIDRIKIRYETPSAHVEQEKTNDWEKEKLPWNKLLCLRKNQSKQNWKKISSEPSMEFDPTKKFQSYSYSFWLAGEKNEGSPEIFECFNVKLLKSTLFRKYFGRNSSHWFRQIGSTAIWFNE